MERPASSLIRFLALVAAIPLMAGFARAGWLGDWQYRRTVEIYNGSGSDLTDYQVRVLLDATFDYAKAAADGSDLRVTASDGQTEIPFWIETWSPIAESACLWVKVPSIPSGGATVQLYYGRAGADSQSDGDATFEAYDGFEEFPYGNPGEWSRYPGNPILHEGPPGSWDQTGATFASVMWDEGAGEFRMYYHGFSGNVHQIGLATSPDGLNWTKYPGNPILTPGPAMWDSQSVRVPMVWKEGDTYHMIYSGFGLGCQIGYAYSTDGVVWTKYAGNPVFNDPTWAHNATENWGVMKVGDEYIAWYGTGGMRQSGLAVSTDLIHWSPYQAAPIFACNGDPSDDRFSQFCPFSFKYGDDFYTLVCSYDAGNNYSSLYLYRCPNPYFLEADRHLVRIAHTVGPYGAWDSHDSDTPAVLTLDVERTQFYNNELWCYYAAEGGVAWRMGLHFETDIAAALADAPVPDIEWHAEGAVTTVNAPVRQGSWSKRLDDTSAGSATWVRGSFTPRQKGAVGAWMRRSSAGQGDYDVYLYGDGGTTRACVAGLGRDGEFHLWRGAGQQGAGGFEPTGVAWAVDTWYLVTIGFDATTGHYSFSVHDEDLTKIVDVPDIAFSEPSVDLSLIDFYTSVGYVGQGYLDDYRLREWCGVELETLVSEEQEPANAPETNGPSPVRLALLTSPNPFHTLTEIRYDVSRHDHVRLDVYDLLGRRVATLVDELQTPGRRSTIWDGRNLGGERVASGTYLYRLRNGSLSETMRMTLLR